MISPLDSAIFGPLFRGPDDIAAIFSDRQRVADLVRVELALARAEGSLGIIPEPAARAIEAAANALTVDLKALARGVATSGVPAIDLVRQLRAATGPPWASFVHRGATSQDIVDTAAVIALRRATDLLQARLRDTIGALADLADRHRETVQAGRTHGQQAVPITFGFKAAGWLAPLSRHVTRLEQLAPRVFVVQFGGAAGTLAALTDRGLEVGDALARELGLGAAIPWHTQRDSLAEYGSWLSLLTSSLAKMAQDIVLLSQSEIAEVAESADPDRGGSSTMPHKVNPIACEMILVAARANAGLLSALHASAVQEHERATHGWQVEWFTLPQMTALAAGALTHAVFVARHLRVDVDRMRENMRSAQDIVLTEALTLLLSSAMPMEDAQTLVRDASVRARRDRMSVVDAARRVAAERGVDGSVDWTLVGDPAAHVGVAARITERVVADARRLLRE